MRHPLPYIALALLGLSTTASADSFGPAGDPYRGRYTFVFVGASMTDSSGLENGVNCLLSSATANVNPADIPSRAKLLQATLYVSGSLLDDGLDVINPPSSIFDTPGLQFPDEIVDTLALAEADRDVEFFPPGATSPIPVQANPNDVFITGFNQTQPIEEVGDVAFFVSRIDVTQEINELGRGFIEGDYTVSGLRADVCNGEEVACDGGVSSCATTSAIHTKGTASFGLLLILEDPTLPLVSLNVFHGLRDLIGPAVFPAAPLSQTLDTGTAELSDPAVGRLAFYALEGDLSRGRVTASPPCQSDEYILVDGDSDISVGGLCLVDDDNPRGNIFNSTVNTQLATTAPDPACPPPPYLCCNLASDKVCDEAGVDIDTFDISPALEPGATQIRVEVDTGEDRIALAVLVVEANIFEPVVDADTRVTVTTATEGFVQLGGELEYRIAVSNTGNATAYDLTVFMNAPLFTTGLAIRELPAGATDLSSPVAGDGNGAVRVEGFDVPPGQVAEIAATMRSTCPALGEELTTTAQVLYKQNANDPDNEAKVFEVVAEPVIATGPGVDDCAGDDPTGFFADGPFDIRALRGGGALGCSSLDPSGLLFLLGLAVMGLLRRRRAEFKLGHKTGGTWAGIALLALAVGVAACGERRVPDPPPLPDPVLHITSLDALGGDRCGSDVMVRVTREDQTTFCIDRFEASIDEGTLGNTQQGLDDTDTEPDGSTEAIAFVDLDVPPATNINWWQAKTACLNAGKRLCTATEWERACRGLEDRIYPYATVFNELACNGFFSPLDEQPANTGALRTCGSEFSVFDLSGNVEEWVEDSIERLPGQAEPPNDRVVRGGSYLSNESGLACFGVEFHSRPVDAEAERGFRCCSNGPI